MKVNIALVGGQSAPVFNVIDHYRPERVIFIASKKTIESVKLIQDECISIGIDDFATIELDPTNPSAIARRAAELCREYLNDEVIVNISSGTKPWSHIFGYLFQGMKNSKVVYIDQNNIVYDFQSMSTEQYEHFDWERYFRLNDTKMSATQLSEYDESDIEVAKKLFGFWNKRPEVMTELAVITGSNKNAVKKKEGCINFNRSVVEWHLEEDGRYILTITWAEKQKLVVKSKHARDLAFNSGWSEIYVAKLFQDWRERRGMEGDGVIVNCVFPAQNKKPKNEVDVLVNAGQKPLFVECKTKISKINDIDKFRSVAKNYGGLGSKGIFVSFSYEEQDKLEKLKDNNLLFYSLKDGVEGLYALIDRELSTINER